MIDQPFSITTCTWRNINQLIRPINAFLKPHSKSRELLSSSPNKILANNSSTYIVTESKSFFKCVAYFNEMVTWEWGKMMDKAWHFINPLVTCSPYGSTHCVFAPLAGIHSPSFSSSSQSPLSDHSFLFPAHMVYDPPLAAACDLGLVTESLPGTFYGTLRKKETPLWLRI